MPETCNFPTSSAQVTTNMQLSTPPRISAVEVIATQPSEVDRAEMKRLGASSRTALAAAQVSYLVKVQMKEKPPVTSMAWRLYAGDALIPKYWEYEGGIYFTVVDPQFFEENKGKKLRFSQDGVKFFDSGAKLAGPPAVKAATRSAKTKAGSRGAAAPALPSQADVLK